MLMYLERKSTRLNSSHPSISFFTLSLHDALPIYNALALLFFLANHVAENAALFVLEPFVRGTQLVFNAPRHKDGCGDLRVRVGPLFSRKQALIFENADVFRAEEHTSELQSPVHLVLHSFPTRRSSDLQCACLAFLPGEPCRRKCSALCP